MKKITSLKSIIISSKPVKKDVLGPISGSEFY